MVSDFDPGTQGHLIDNGGDLVYEAKPVKIPYRNPNLLTGLGSI
jgi:hypothetical protein